MIKRVFKLIKLYLPDFLKRKLDQKVLENKLDKHRERKQRVFVALEEINTILDNFDLNCDLIIHSSTSNIGKIEGNAKQLTDLIISKLDLDNHTLLSPALPFLGSMKEYLDSLESFELETAKNAMGNISNQIMKMDGCQRSFHPSHSVIAIGRNADFYISEHEKCNTPFCKESPYWKLTMNNGKILMFGVGLNSITNFHVYEDMLGEYLPLDVYASQVYKIACKNGDIRSEIETRAHNPMLSAKRDCERAREYLIKNNYIQTYKIGDSEISLLDAKGLTLTLLQMLIDGKSIYGKVKLSKEQIYRVVELIESIK
ncbi:MAG: AAC(3) family N-acetyltransferase [Sulfurovaceae bacterium]